MKKKLLVRVDANQQIGSGHFMRCLALAQAWCKEGGEAVFAMKAVADTFKQRLKQEGIGLAEVTQDDPEVLLAGLRKSEIAWIVVDGYHFDGDFQKRLQQSGIPVLVIDDEARLPFYAAKAVLNQNPGVTEAVYAAADSDLLLGERYVLLRNEFLDHRLQTTHEDKKQLRMLVTMGGSDPENATAFIVEALRCLPHDLKIQVLIGPNYAFLEDLRAEIKDYPKPISLVMHVTSVPDLFDACDVVISAAGSTCWELAFMGKPMCVMALAPNQEVVARAIEQKDMGWVLGRYRELTHEQAVEKIRCFLEQSEKRRQRVEHAKKVVDGKGASRIAKYLLGVNGL